jgi:hypothetical protein
MKGAFGALVSGMVVSAAIPLLLGLLFVSPLVLLFILVYAAMSGKESG